MFIINQKVEKSIKKHAVIIGRSNLNGKPMAQLLLKKTCTVTLVHSKTKNLQHECLKADILVAAVGKPNLVQKDWVKENVIIIDVGINKVGEKIVGDVKFDELKDKSKQLHCARRSWSNDNSVFTKNTLECFKDHQL